MEWWELFLTLYALFCTGIVSAWALWSLYRRAADIVDRATATPDAKEVVSSLTPEELVSLVTPEQLSALADAAYDAKRRTAR